MIYDRLERDGRVSEYYEKIQECMKPTQCSWDSKHSKIIQACSSIVTTNIDGVFEKTITDELTRESKVQKYSYQTLSNLDAEKVTNPYHITYLHGRYDEKEIILKTFDYYKFYQVRNGGVPSKLENVLTKIFCGRKGIVFVGFSFEDRFILEVFERGFQKLKEKMENTKKPKEEVCPEEIKHYALLENPFKEGQERERYLMENRLNILPENEDWPDKLKNEKREKLEKRLREINIKIIRYNHDNHKEIEPYFEGICNKKRSVENFIQQ